MAAAATYAGPPTATEGLGAEANEQIGTWRLRQVCARVRSGLQCKPNSGDQGGHNGGGGRWLNLRHSLQNSKFMFQTPWNLLKLP